MTTLLWAISILGCAALLADAPVVAVLIWWLGLAGAVTLIFGAASMIGSRPGEEDSRAP